MSRTRFGGVRGGRGVEGVIWQHLCSFAIDACEYTGPTTSDDCTTPDTRWQKTEWKRLQTYTRPCRRGGVAITCQCLIALPALGDPRLARVRGIFVL